MKEGRQLAMFTNLLPGKPPPEPEAFVKLREAKAAAEPRKSTFICASHTHACIEVTIPIVERLLERRQDWLASSHPDRVNRAKRAEVLIERNLADARFRLGQLTRQQAQRSAAACAIQRAALDWLYRIGADGIPPISRSLVRDGTLATEDTIGALGDGDGDE